MGSLFFIVVILGAVAFWFISVYNKLIRMVEVVNNNKNQPCQNQTSVPNPFYLLCIETDIEEDVNQRGQNHNS